MWGLLGVLLLFELKHINEYNSKARDFLTTNNIVSLDKDPTTKYRKEINKKINECKHLFNQNMKKPPKYDEPKLKTLPKIHKPDVSIRPLVNFTSAPSYKIAKFLECTTKNKVNLDPNHSLLL